MSTLQITLTATLTDYSGAAIGSAATPAFLRIALAGYRGVLPCVPGTAMVGKVTSWPGDIPYTGSQITVPLWGNDVITPAGTWYSISVLDANKNVIQTGAYQFTGTQTIDLSNAVPLPIQGAVTLAQAVPNGLLPGVAFMLPALAVAGMDAPLFYNGQLQLPSKLGTYEVNGKSLTLFFKAQPGDSIFQIFATTAMGAGPALIPWMSVANGQFPGTAYTVPTAPPNAQLAGVFYNGLLLPPSMYALIGGNLVLTFTTDPPDPDTGQYPLIQLLYMLGKAPALNGAAPTGAFPGTVYTLAGTLAVGLWQGAAGGPALFLRPGIDYTLSGSTITLKTTTQAGDGLYAI